MFSSRWIIAGIAVLAAGAGLYYYTANGNGELPDGITSGNGRIEAVQVDISSRIAGRVATVEVKEGDLVETGQLVATIETRELEAQLSRAQAEYASVESQVAAAEAAIAQAEARLLLADQELERTRELVSRGVATAETLDVRLSDHKVAEANLTVAEASLLSQQRAVDAARFAIEEVQSYLDDARLTAPTLGRVLYRLTEPGEVIGAGGRVLTMVDLTDVYLEFFLPATEAHLLSIGSEARIRLDIADVVIPAKVSFVSPVSQFTPKQVETASERQDLMFRVRVRVPQPLVEANIDLVKTGIRGVAYVRLASETLPDWPEFLNNIPPELTAQE
ncbi:HlyD family secretion protein [Phaeobacter gallaeciensis]|uniref:HlyD family secretion protein n=1 Tax=Phaeobacter gallaeciensis TaxID=60890 RepID=UPI00237EF51F|nr:HlyD family efflux transporter periplasmic adaptor subunit [Phaeobacter gallaeciensis]MDE4191726.1 HlyD family efflux transporter periplasmic adaptor subunit [Phaeobacter gallaeciensis]MDE4200189.1 HlyD family efflux transporter periplasmic adaptor subunit [Phaeobacter gallaeciensis]MDE4204363.1 HlyD family efflux transporter periplasmic adaptor subunit [Phaeobacter gallaeciensis]MDE4208481.1 HlyD family efflux transporter periplasmic adaptor subunit [Phaeobacter gallaeciensis]MDE4216872.1 